MRPVKLKLAVAMLLSAALLHAGDSPDPTIGRLAKVEQFAFGPTGYAGVISVSEKDYMAILSRPSALADFEKLLSLGNPQAKAYALVGIRTLNPSRFKELFTLLKDSKEEVAEQRGCIISNESLGIVLKHIGAGEYSKAK